MKILTAILSYFSRCQMPVANAFASSSIDLPTVIQIDPRIQSIKKIAAMRLSKQRVPIEMAVGMSDRTKEWLLTLTTEMLLLVISASYSQLREHLASRRTIRGLLAADADSIAAYKKALHTKIVTVDSDGRRGGGGPKRPIGGMKLGR